MQAITLLVTRGSNQSQTGFSNIPREEKGKNDRSRLVGL
jgi:hypothetical protein